MVRLGALFPQARLNEEREELTDYQVKDSGQLRTDRFWGLVLKDLRISELTKLMRVLIHPILFIQYYLREETFFWTLHSCFSH